MNNKKKMLLITQGFPYGEGELSFLSIEFERLLEEYDISIMAYDNNEPLKYFTNESVTIKKFSYKNKLDKLCSICRTVLCLAMYREIIRAWNKENLINTLFRIRNIIIYQIQANYSMKIIRSIIEEKDISLIYTYWCTPETLAAVRLKNEYDIKVITRAHGVDLYDERLVSHWQPFRHEISKKCDLIVLACKNAKEYFDYKWGGKTNVSYLGTKYQSMIVSENCEKIVMVSCSNIIEIKRIPIIIEALSLLPSNIKIEWHHFGDGICRENVERIANELLNDKEGVEYYFHGFIENDKLIEIYKKIKPHIFITTSSTEGGCPVSIQEAYSLGIPAIGTNVGGIPDIIIDHFTGILLEENPSIYEVRDAILEFSSLNYEEKQLWRQNARTRWEEYFNADECANKFIMNLKKI